MLAAWSVFASPNAGLSSAVAGSDWAGLGYAGRSPPHIFVYRAGMGWVGLGWAGSPSRWARLGCGGLGGALCTFLYTGLGWAGLSSAGLGCAGLVCAGLCCAGLGFPRPGWAELRWAFSGSAAVGVAPSNVLLWRRALGLRAPRGPP